LSTFLIAAAPSSYRLEVQPLDLLKKLATCRSMIREEKGDNGLSSGLYDL
jgi:hypothetical protein